MKNSPATLIKRNKLRKHWKQSKDPSTVVPFIEKLCSTCGMVRKCAWATTFTQTGTPEYRSRCIECHRLFHRCRSRARRTTISLSKVLRRRARKLECVAYLGGSCSKCSYDKCARAMTFHHKERAEKVYEISQMMDAAWEKLRIELDKCVLVCFNCHMEIEGALYESVGH